MDIHYEAQPSSVYTKPQSGCSVTGLYHRMRGGKPVLRG